MLISIIVPVLNEAPTIVGFLHHLCEVAPLAEIILVDGGSTDGTAESSSHIVDYVISAPLGRAKQMNAGAKIATGDVFWFVHADSRIAPGSLAAIEVAFNHPGVVGGCFRLEIIPTRWIYRIRDAIGNFCVDLSGVALGDRGFFCRRDVFLRSGGYPEISLLEDAELYRKVKRYGRVRQLREKVQTSARRYEALGPFTTVCFYGFVMTLYVLRVPLSTLETIVHWYVVRATDPASASTISRTDRANQDVHPQRISSGECLRER